MGVPGNCPDHDGAVAGAAVSIASQVPIPGMAALYGSDPTKLPGHDHLVGVASTHGDFNVAWEVIEVLFTNAAAANNELTTLKAVNDAIGSGNAIAVDLGFAFHCSIVSVAAYNAGTPIG
jgi:hypothetical protein